MKKIIAFFFASAIMINSFAAVNVEVPTLKASQVNLPLSKTGKSVSLLALSEMSVKEYQTLTGERMKLMDKFAFKMSQRELKKVINNDGTVNVKKLETLNKKMQKAVDNKRNLRLALIFLGAAVVLSIIGSFVPFLWILASLAYLASVVYFIIWLVNMAA